MFPKMWNIEKSPLYIATGIFRNISYQYNIFYTDWRILKQQFPIPLVLVLIVLYISDKKLIFKTSK